jgi:Raf kinase inhibitor-like YbhB/YbcL family protein
MRWRAVVVLAALVACSRGAATSIPSPTARFSLTSPSFGEGRAIPSRFTCDGQNESPPLAWSGSPSGDWSVLVVSDPDAPGGVFVHWVMAVPPGTSSLPAGRAPAGAIQGRNSFGHRRYDGPCPPRGDQAHRYVFRMFALEGNGAPDLSGFPNDPGDVGSRAEAEGTLTGTYGR